MNIKEMQKRAAIIIEEHNKNHNLQHNKDTVFHHLVEEVGELAREIHNEKNPWRAEFNKDKLAEELIDTLFQILTLADDYNINIEEAFNKKIAKLRERYQLGEEKRIEREFVSTVYIVKDGKVLLNKNNKLKKFIPVGGHIEENETPEEAAVREAREETGFEIQILNPRITNHIISTEQRKEIKQNLGIGLDIIKENHQHINLFYIGKIISGTQKDFSDDGAELRWFSKEELESEEVMKNSKFEALEAIKLAQQYL